MALLASFLCWFVTKSIAPLNKPHTPRRRGAPASLSGFARRYTVPARMTTTMVAASISQLMTGLLARV